MYKALGLLLLLVELINCSVNIITIPVPNTNYIASDIWDYKSNSIYAIDFISPPGVNSIYRVDYRTFQIIGAQIIGEQSLAFLLPVEGCDDLFIVGLLNYVKLIRWDGVSPTATVVRTLFEVKGHLNYALVDKDGRLYTGTVNETILCSAPNEFAMYRYAEGQLTKIFTNLKSTTGLTIDYKRNKFYHADGCGYQILEFDYDCETGDICNGRVVYDFRNSGITPYPIILGLKVDQNGYVYCTTYGIGLLFIIDPITSMVVKKISFPSPGVTDVYFAGPNMDELYVSAARIIFNPYGGGILQNRSTDETFFRVDGLGARGFNTHRVRLGSSSCSNKNWSGK